MSRKRRNTSSAEPDSPSTRQRSVSLDYSSDESDISESRQRPQIDAATGQSGAFPGLGDDDDVFYGPAADGIDYLRMVRSERRDIPELLTALKAPAEEDVEDGGYWYDGAYTARPTTQKGVEMFSRAQQLYYDALLDRFRTAQAAMRRTPALSDIQALDASRPISFPEDQGAARDAWEKILVRQEPHPVQIACMDAGSVLRTINLITRKMGFYIRPGNPAGTSRLGSWAWSLLARVPERGELGSEEISDLRQLVQRMYEVVEGIQNKENGNVKQLKTQDVETETDIQDEDDGAVARAGIEITLAKQIMVVDMVVTVVGEEYGQRDLLDLRKPWT